MVQSSAPSWAGRTGKTDKPRTWPYKVWYGAIPPSYWTDWTIGVKNYRRYEQLYQFHSRLLADVERNGFKNPICVWAWDQTVRVPYGRSRAFVAKKLGIPVPAFVCDLLGNPYWEQFELVTGVEQALSKFTDLPAVLEFRDDKFHFWGCEQTHLPEHAAEFRLRQIRYNARRLQRPDVRERRIEWFYRDIPSATAA